MKFIADQAANQGLVQYTKHFHLGDGRTKDNSEEYDMRPIIWDTPTCNVTYHPKITTNGVVTFDRVFSFNPKDVTKIQMIDDLAAFDNQESSSLGISNVVSYTPSIYAVHLRMKPVGHKEPGTLELRFTDADDADRVAKALTHAAELCGGGNKDPF